MNISVGGQHGSGKTTVSRLLTERLNLKHCYTGKIMRDLALKRGISLVELQKQAKTDKTVDEEVDARQIEIGKNEDNYLIEGLLAYHFAPNSVKVFLKADKVSCLDLRLSCIYF